MNFLDPTEFSHQVPHPLGKWRVLANERNLRINNPDTEARLDLDQTKLLQQHRSFP